MIGHEIPGGQNFESGFESLFKLFYFFLEDLLRACRSVNAASLDRKQ